MSFAGLNLSQGTFLANFPVEVPLFIGTRRYLCNCCVSAKHVGVTCYIGKN